ncbi:MAG: hypothetical protein ACFCU9_00065 [Cyanophyceae cyanobacterium]|jgi:hypothetical protein
MLALLLYAIALVMLVIGVSLWLQSVQSAHPSGRMAPEPDQEIDRNPQQVGVIEQLERQFRNSPSHNPEA